MSVRYHYAGPHPELAGREILGCSVERHHETALARFGAGRGAASWRVQIGGELLFDAAGLALVDRAVRGYGGDAGRLAFALAVTPAVFRDYYSLGRDAAPPVGLPIVAVREGCDGPLETLTLELPSARETVPLPPGLGEPTEIGVPHALLMPYHGPFDLLFANQIAVVSAIRRRVARNPWTWLRALVRRSGVRGLDQRIARCYRAVDPSAEVHPTAVVEGSVVGRGARVGAHCVVRYSVVGERARLHDGAKVELSVVGEGAWLMHDLVLYRSVAEAGAFLIHGPYQFSYFQRGSGAFATIMMDYRPDARPIQVKTAHGLKPYGGRFLGSVVGEGAKTLGGSMLAPGRIVPAATWLAADPEQIHMMDDAEAPTRRPLPPRALARKGNE
jgi:hypothetical protein